jgi:NAD(P)H-dependent flavin oxidoreductase YrpB (nitropropane dioxygenase family)
MVSWGEAVPDPVCGVTFNVPLLASTDVIPETARGARVAEFFYAAPDPELVRLARRATPIVGWQVGSVEEAQAAVDAGCDYVVAQGTEAGGHIRGRDRLDVLLRAVLERVAVPVVAAGGIATSERVAELIDLGAEGVRLGTRFLACPESGAHEDYVANLIAASADDTVVTEWFDAGWPNAPHRVLRPALDAARRSGWREAQPPCRGIDRDVVDMAQYAGMSVAAVTSVEPAADVLADLVRML